MEEKLSRELVNQIVDRAVKAVLDSREQIVKEAARAAVEQYKAEREARLYKIRDKRYQNTRLLLTKWRELEDYYHHAIFDEAGVAQGYGAELMAMIGAKYEQRVVNSVRNKVAFTTMVMTNFECAFKLYKEFCEMTGKEEYKRRWRVIYKLFLDCKKVMTPQEVADSENISRSQVYADVNIAIKDLDKRLFGLDPEYFDFE